MATLIGTFRMRPPSTVLPATDLHGRKDAGKAELAMTASAIDARPSSPYR